LDSRWKPNVTVAGLCERDGRFLLVEETTPDGPRLNQPAGHLEDGETLVEAAMREVREETAWKFAPQSLVGVYQWRDAAHERTFMRFSFAGVAHDHDPAQRLDDGILRAVWLTRGEIAAAAERFRSPWVLICVDDYLAGRRMPLDLIRSL
jgi:8-oxo-dGTP pyrophosphatase MutT (NUDIX family)